MEDVYLQDVVYKVDNLVRGGISPGIIGASINPFEPLIHWRRNPPTPGQAWNEGNRKCPGGGLARLITGDEKRRRTAQEDKWNCAAHPQIAQGEGRYFPLASMVASPFLISEFQTPPLPFV